MYTGTHFPSPQPLEITTLVSIFESSEIGPGNLKLCSLRCVSDCKLLWEQNSLMYIRSLYIIRNNRHVNKILVWYIKLIVYHKRTNIAM